MRQGLIAVLLIGLAWWLRPGSPAAPTAQGEIGLFTTLPILWSEADDVADLLKARNGAHWARPVLAGKGRIVPLDRLTGPPGNGPLDRLDRLVIAQPRPLGADENIALDAWVRGGGHLLLFADPMLTGGSAFDLGDPRRPQAMAMLSPILGHWGLRLEFDDAQPFGERQGSAAGLDLPVNLPGRLVPGGSGGHSCRIEPGGLAAHCRIGRGQALVIADAAMLERSAVEPHAATLSALLDQAFTEVH